MTPATCRILTADDESRMLSGDQLAQLRRVRAKRPATLIRHGDSRDLVLLKADRDEVALMIAEAVPA